MKLLAIGLLAAACGLHADFRAAAVKVDITPDTVQPLLGYAARNSTGVHDRLYHRIAGLDDGTRQFFLVSTDICLVSPAFYEETAAELERATGVGRMQFWWSFSHTHSAPEVGGPGLARAFLPDRYNHKHDEAYAARVRNTLIEGVREARAKLAPARLSMGTGMAMANINRRAKDVDGKIKLGLNPYGVVDRQIGLIRVERMTGELVTVVYNYAIHGTALGGLNTLISGDAPGVVSAYLEQKLGVPVLFANGAAGNIAPLYSVASDFRQAHITEFNVLLGDRVLGALERMPKAVSAVSLWFGEKVLETPRQAGLGWTEELAPFARVTADGTAMVRLPVRFLRINDTAIWAAPLELFCEVALDVRAQSQFANTFYFGYTNGWLGYLPTRQAFPEGGYETTVTPFTDRAAEELTAMVSGFLAGMPR